MADQRGRYSLRRFFDVTAVLDEVDVERMRPGMSVKLLVEEPPIADVLLVPRAALVWDGGEPRALEADGTAVRLELGPCNAHHCVVEGGLAEGTELRRSEVTR